MSQSPARLDAIADAVYALARLDFSHDLPLADDEGSLDGLAAAVNMLKEEILAQRAAQAANEETMRRQQDQLRQAQKMDAIGRLAGGVAHDFNNVLSVILSYAEIATASVPACDPLREDLQEIRIAGERAASLTRQLLLFSRQQVVELRTIDMNEVVRGMHNMLRRLVGEDVELVYRQNARSAAIQSDPGLIEQVIMNLVVNARDAMPAGGALVIETADVTLDEQFVATHLDARLGRHVMLAVTDSGTGMDAATLARIFEPFFTTKARGKGTGLGLSTVFGIVTQAGGCVYVDSTPGTGTRFELYFPHSAAVEAPSLPRTRTDGLRGNETVLLVEDEDQVRTVSVAILRRQGYQVLEARGGDEAIAICQQHRGPIHLMITDVIMPKVSGPQVAERALALRPDLRVLFVSGYTDDVIVHHGVQAGTHFLQKPLTPRVLARKVRDILDGSSLSGRAG
jgi:two-component system, cell cycle sensor histidine kinase and response regulator CckA